MLPLHELWQGYKLTRNLPEGAIVECGCWKGGNAAFLAKVSGRKTWAFDSFEGLPEATEYDRRIREKRNLPIGSKVGYIKAEIDYAREINGKLGTEVEIVKGWFKDTLPKHKKEIGPIAFLRLDGDLYESTLDILRNLYDQVTPGGVVVVDDYIDFDGCRRAIYEFFVEKGITPRLRTEKRGEYYFFK